MKIKLGELVVDRKVWVRSKISLDHVTCLSNDLVNGAVFPPLKVDKNTNIIIGGNHRYYAYRKYFGDGWEGQEVECEFVDLQPFEENPEAWYVEALGDNDHLVKRLGYRDRNKTAKGFLKVISDPETPEAQEIAKRLHFTPQGWLEFSSLVLDSFEKAMPEKKKHSNGRAPRQAIQKGSGDKTSVDSIYPSDVKDPGVNALVMSRAARLINMLQELDPDYLSAQSRNLLQELAEIISGVLGVKAS